jgi:maltokinase
VRFVREKGGELPAADQTSIALTGEQSNTSLVFGDEAILKVFRKLEVGVNPDLELHAALTAHGSPHVAAMLGGVSAELPDGERIDLAIMQRFLSTATDGWRLALASVHDLLAEGDLHPEECGGDFASEAERLGMATAEVHDALAGALETSELDAGMRATLVSEMRGRLDVAISTAPSVQPLAAAISAVYDTLADSTDPIVVQRVHGDLHLGQVVRTTAGWYVLDFEGEPNRSLAQRRSPDSPLRDVAGMLRSFDYAAHRPLLEDRGGAQRLYRAREWAVRNRSAFLDGYARAGAHDPRASSVLLRAYELDKALYEVVYESRLRPEWVAIPLDAVARLSEERAA